MGNCSNPKQNEGTNSLQTKDLKLLLLGAGESGKSKF
jgi:hypothetical protein